MTARVDVLRVLDAVANGIHSPNEGEVRIAHHTLHDFLEARAAVAELIDIAKAAVEFDGGTSYYDSESEVGSRCCCQVAEYKPHEPSCWVPRLKDALSRVTGGE